MLWNYHQDKGSTGDWLGLRMIDQKNQKLFRGKRIHPLSMACAEISVAQIFCATVMGLSRLDEIIIKLCNSD